MASRRKTRAKSKRTRAPESPQQGQPAQRGRLPAILLIAGLILLVCWWVGLLAVLPRKYAEGAMRRADPDAALKWARTAARLAPPSARSHHLLARAYRRQGNWPAFHQSLKEAVERGLPAHTAAAERVLAAAQAGHLEGLHGRLDALLVESPLDGRDVLEAYVNGSMKAGQLGDAGRLLDGWAAAYPDDPQAFYYRARLLMHFGKSNEAEADVRKALSLAPDHAPAHYLLGKIFTERNEHSAAAAQYRAASEAAFPAAAEIALAGELRASGDPDDARSLLQRTVRLPHEEVRKSFLRLGERFEGDPAARELGQLELAAGHAAAAVDWLDRALKADPQDLAARQARGLALRQVDRREEAEADLRAVSEARAALREVDRLVDQVTANPSLVEERVRIGELYLKHGSSQTGEFWLKTALARDPNNEEAKRLLAELRDERDDQNQIQGGRDHERTAE